MAFNFTSDMSNPINQVRLMVGDTDSTDAQLQDEAISAYLPGGPLAAGSVYLAAAQCCEAIASAYARQIDLKIGNTTASPEPRMAHYRQRAKDLRAQNLRYGGLTPYSGGISISDKETIEGNTDRKEPAFTVTTGDDQGGGSGTAPAFGWWGF